MVNFKRLAIATAALFVSYSASAPIAQDGEARIASEHGKVIEGSYIVTLKSGLSTTDLKSHVEWVGDVHKRSIAKRDTKGVERTYAGQYDFRAYAGSFDKDTLAEIRKNPDVARVEQDKVWDLFYMRDEARAHALEKRSLTTQHGATWGLGAVSHRKPGSSDYIYDTNSGRGTFAYVVDTGCRITHQEFEGRATRVYSAFPNDQEDTIGHGTHVSGTIAGKTYGVAKQAQILAVKVFQGSTSSTSLILAGFNFAANDIINKGRTNKAAINMSLGGGKSDSFNQAVDSASKSGVLSIVAAGNDDQDANNVSPASVASAITVAALNSDWTRAYYSNYGPAIDIFGPGTEITSAWYRSDTDTNVVSGTSMASPHIVGLALNAISLNQASGVDGVTQYLKNTASKNAVVGDTKGSANLIGNNNNSQQ